MSVGVGEGDGAGTSVTVGLAVFSAMVAGSPAARAISPSPAAEGASKAVWQALSIIAATSMLDPITPIRIFYLLFHHFRGPRTTFSFVRSNLLVFFEPTGSGSFF
jgi:hypothetical protein